MANQIVKRDDGKYEIHGEVKEVDKDGNSSLVIKKISKKVYNTRKAARTAFDLKYGK